MLQDTHVFHTFSPCILDDIAHFFLVPSAYAKHRCRRPGLGYDIKENGSINRPLALRGLVTSFL